MTAENHIQLRSDLYEPEYQQPKKKNPEVDKKSLRSEWFSGSFLTPQL